MWWVWHTAYSILGQIKDNILPNDRVCNVESENVVKYLFYQNDESNWYLASLDWLFK